MTHSKKRILLIDKDPSVIDVITLVLQDDGYDVFIASKPFNMSEVISINPNAIVLHNGINNAGVEICRTIKEVNETKIIPVILTSTQLNIPEIAGSCNADAFLLKPFDIDELSLLIKKTLNPPI